MRSIVNHAVSHHLDASIQASVQRATRMMVEVDLRTGDKCCAIPTGGQEIGNPFPLTVSSVIVMMNLQGLDRPMPSTEKSAA
jgi:hypothetical protein